MRKPFSKETKKIIARLQSEYEAELAEKLESAKIQMIPPGLWGKLYNVIMTVTNYLKNHDKGYRGR